VNMNQWNGILLWSSHNNVLTDNRTLRNMYGVILSESNNNELSGNTALPNIVLILPIVLIYMGILWYQFQKYVFRLIFMRG
jgi:parallel beta-helix repeat protein